MFIRGGEKGLVDGRLLASAALATLSLIVARAARFWPLELEISMLRHATRKLFLRAQLYRFLLVCAAAPCDDLLASLTPLLASYVHVRADAMTRLGCAAR